MKAKLNKVDNGYVLLVDNIMYATDNDKLSKENCDEIFGVVDVEKLEIECMKNTINQETGSDIHRLSVGLGFKKGFNKAMELNKDKVFTLEDMEKAIDVCIELMNNKGSEFRTHKQTIIQSLKQPTEIEVEIEYMFSVEENGESTNTGITKLDENGCLILKRI